jgi:hypothetical protein
MAVQNEILHECDSDDGVRVMNFATQKVWQSEVWCSHIATSKIFRITDLLNFVHCPELKK